MKKNTAPATEKSEPGQAVLVYQRAALHHQTARTCPRTANAVGIRVKLMGAQHDDLDTTRFLVGGPLFSRKDLAVDQYSVDLVEAVVCQDKVVIVQELDCEGRCLPLFFKQRGFDFESLSVSVHQKPT